MSCFLFSFLLLLYVHIYSYIHRLKIATPVDSKTSELEDLTTKGSSVADINKPDTEVRQRKNRKL